MSSFSCLYIVDHIQKNSVKQHCPKSLVNVLPSKGITPVWLFTLLKRPYNCLLTSVVIHGQHNVNILQPPDSALSQSRQNVGHYSLLCPVSWDGKFTFSSLGTSLKP
jgi:hypothetical protein